MRPPFDVGDRVLSLGSGQVGDVIAIRAMLNGEVEVEVALVWEVYIDVETGHRYRQATTVITAPPDHFILVEDVPVHDREALEEWLAQ